VTTPEKAREIANSQWETEQMETEVTRPESHKAPKKDETQDFQQKIYNETSLFVTLRTPQGKEKRKKKEKGTNKEQEQGSNPIPDINVENHPGPALHVDTGERR